METLWHSVTVLAAKFGNQFFSAVAFSSRDAGG